MGMLQYGYSALKRFVAAKPRYWMLRDKQEEESFESGKQEWYEVQRLVFDGSKSETRWWEVARLKSYDCACAVMEIASANEPVGSCKINIACHRECLGWRIIRVTDETWHHQVIRQMKSVIISPEVREVRK